MVPGRTEEEEHRGDVTSRADALSGATPFTSLTDSGSAYSMQGSWTREGGGGGYLPFWTLPAWSLDISPLSRCCRPAICRARRPAGQPCVSPNHYILLLGCRRADRWVSLSHTVPQSSVLGPPACLK
ncbi:unnamed protein product [Boreogadus saida]